MTPSAKLLISFFVTSVVVLLLAFLVHRYAFSTTFGAMHLLQPAYSINFLLAAAIFVGLYSARHKLKNALGFVFMGGSFVKFAVFFVVFYPAYKADGEIQNVEFAAFFVPYVLALIVETYFASKMLNQMSDS
ncbi:MAG: DUF6168 family protein [Bacteroidota bacterium]